MEWATTYYSFMSRNTEFYSSDIRSPDRDRARVVAELPGLDSAASVLELGIGGGQTALATALEGYRVTGIDLIALSVESAQRLADKYPEAKVQFSQADMYSYKPAQQFSAVTYWDGFGVGEDQDQIHLLNQIASWLLPKGRAVIEVYDPLYWSKMKGFEQSSETRSRQYDFDAATCRMIDTWTIAGETHSQTLRCYSLADFQLLLSHTPLQLLEYVPGGGFDPETREYHENAPLGKAYSYRATLACKQ